MRSFIIISVICMQIWSHGVANAAGVGAFAYQDSAGNRYGGTYGLKNNQVYNVHDFPTFAPVPFADFSDVNTFFPEYFRNFENLLQEFGGVPNFGFAGQDFGMPGFENRFGNVGPNSAFAAGAVGPGFRHQMAAINPPNPNMPNVDVTQYSDAATAPRDGNGFYSVSSSSYSSSSNVNGKQENRQGGETIVNDNGKVTKYKVHN
ncbi:uncharacterized protein LOC126372469 isoform X2 [Pectinophora gossypiella]|uniref:uncharacterized protein LOC126372469 isoform X2 n=1 Tax=Pectinophora gossypiella TaxID=13191 RepID=UPI00214E5186|nr:uncharacterized protein LOC126372469 isoform X2 [Pectinophora gossypiella]